MSENKPASPQTLALLGIGSVTALGIAYWSISSALGPSPAARHAAEQTATPPAAPPIAATNTAKSEAPTNPGAAAERAPALDSSTAASPRAAERPGARIPSSSEALLSPGLDPFVSLPPLPGQSQTAAAPQPAEVSRPVPPAVVQRPTRPMTDGNAPYRTDPGPPRNLVAKPPRITPAPVAPPVEEREPELVGTLLGEYPNAVFRDATKIVSVPLGHSFGGWKVINVGQGEVTVKRMGRVVRLQAGGSPFAGEAPRQPGGAGPVSSPSTNLADSSRREGEGITVDSAAPRSRTRAVSDMPAEGDSASTSAALPALRDTPITPEGKVKSLPADTARSQPEAAPDKESEVRTASSDNYRPFRRLVAAPADSQPGAALPIRQ